ncbi:MAG: YceD family protein [Geminicoccaceae bacterium]
MSELTRLAALDQLPAAGRSIEIVADRAERESVARRLELVSLARLEARMHLSHGPRRGIFILRGSFEAEAEQSCVVTFEPVPFAIDVPFERYFSLEKPNATAGMAPGTAGMPLGEVVVGVENEEPEPVFDPVLDVGEIVIEELSLSLDPYPRSPEAETVMQRFRGAEDEDEGGPFARLRRLRGNGS